MGSGNESIQAVESRLLAGASRKEIFESLGRTDDLARSIAMVPLFTDRLANRRWNATLLLILVYMAVLKVGSLIANAVLVGMPWHLILVGIPSALVASWLAVNVYRYRGWSYWMSSAFCIWILSGSLQPILHRTNGTVTTVNLLLLLPVAAGAFLGFFLKRRLCPDLGFLGATTDENGTYNFLKRAG